MILLAGAIGIATVGVSIAGAICAYKTYYGLFRSCKPKPAVLFLALSILTPARPFLPHACHEADEGLPENAAQ